MNQSTSLVRLRRFHFCLWLLAALLLTANSTQAAQILYPGEILVADAVAGTNNSGALFLVNPISGERSILSDFGNTAQGPLGHRDIVGVTLSWYGTIFVSSLFSGSNGDGAIFEVDPQTGDRTVVVDFGQGNFQGYLYYGLAADAWGRLLVNQESSAPPYPSAVVRVDPKTDKRTLVSNFNDSTLNVEFITDLALDQFGGVLVGAILSDADPTIDHSAIFLVNQITGARKLVTDFTNPAQGTDLGDLYFSTGLRESCGRILANSGDSVYAPRNLLFNINPETGNRTVLSDFDSHAQGIPGSELHGLDVEESGNVVVSAENPTNGDQMLFRVNPKNGRRVVFSDSSNAAQGPPFSAVVYIAVVLPGQACP